VNIKLADPVEIEILEAFISPAYGRTIRDELDDQSFGLQSLAIAWDRETPVGYGFIHWPGPRELSVADKIPGCPEIFRMTVSPAHQSTGIGTQIIGFFEQLAKSKGFSSLGLAVSHDNERAYQLYDKLNFGATEVANFVSSYQQEKPDGNVVTITEKCRFLQKLL